MLRIAQGVTMSKYISRDFRSEGARMGTHTLSEAIGKRGMQTRQCPLWFFFLEGEIFFFEVCVSSSDLQLAMKAQKALNFWSFCFHPPPKCKGYRHVTIFSGYVLLGIEPRAAGMLGKNSTSWATCSGPPLCFLIILVTAQVNQCWSTRSLEGTQTQPWEETHQTFRI